MKYFPQHELSLLLDNEKIDKNAFFNFNMGVNKGQDQVNPRIQHSMIPANRSTTKALCWGTIFMDITKAAVISTANVRKI